MAGETAFPLKLILAFLSINILAYCGNLYFELHPNVDWMYDVRILEKYDDYNFRADVADTKGMRHEFGLRFCPDYQPTDDIQPGGTLTYLAYIRDVSLKCYEVGKTQYGYAVKRREDNVPIIDASFARQTAAQRPDEAQRP